MKLRRIAITILVIGAIAAVVVGGTLLYQRYAAPSRTIASVLARYGPAARAALKPDFDRAGVAYPPRRLALLVFKRERRVAIWASNEKAPWRFIRSYPIFAASGVAGPKLRQGDYQVPEGLYRIELLNPASSYHLSMKVGYPNEFDRRMAQRDGRTNLGGDIFIHGKNVSIGCVAIGDAGIEQLFTLVADTGIQRVKVIIAPNDLRVAGASIAESAPLWIGQLYRAIAAALVDFPVALESNSALDVDGLRKESKMILVK